MLLQIHPKNPDERKIKLLVECLLKGGLIIYPTDTVYGIGCDIEHPEAIQRICAIKKYLSKKRSFPFYVPI